MPDIGVRIIIVLGVILVVVGLPWILPDYFLVYRRLGQEDPRGAMNTSLVLGIEPLILGALS